MEISRTSAWNHYFETGDRDPLIRAYWKSIQYIAADRYYHHRDDYFQLGLLGLLKAIDKIDPSRVKSKDAWVWMNVKSMMFNRKPPKKTDELVEGMAEYSENTGSRKFHADEWHMNHADVGGKIKIVDDRFADDFEMYLSHLDKREAMILTLIYQQGWPKTNIAEVFNLSSMRIGQIEQGALDKLRSQLDV